MDDRDRTQRGLLPLGNRSIDAVRANSRLLARGKDLLEESSAYPLQFDGLILFESSIFLIWDRKSALFGDPRSQSDWQNRRSVDLFEFDVHGIYKRRITLPLVDLTSDGYRTWIQRSPLHPTVHSDFIFYTEVLWGVRDESTVRVSYVFDRSGNRMAVWTDNQDFEGFADAMEQPLPVVTGVQITWIVGGALVSLAAHHKNLPVPSDYDDSKSGPYAHTQEFLLTNQDIMDFLKRLEVQRLQFGSMRKNNPIDFRDLAQGVVWFPVSAPIGSNGRYSPQWISRELQPGSIWFLEDTPLWEQPTLIWRLDIESGRAVVYAYSLDNPLQLFREGKFRGIGEEWIDIDDYEEDPLAIVATNFFAWDDELVIAFEIEHPSTDRYEDFVVRFRMMDDQVILIGVVTPIVAGPDALMMQFLSAWWTEDVQHVEYRAGELWSIWHQSEHQRNIFITNVETGRTRRLDTSVPESTIV